MSLFDKRIEAAAQDETRQRENALRAAEDRMAEPKRLQSLLSQQHAVQKRLVEDFAQRTGAKKILEHYSRRFAKSMGYGVSFPESEFTTMCSSETLHINSMSSQELIARSNASLMDALAKNEHGGLSVKAIFTRGYDAYSRDYYKAEYGFYFRLGNKGSKYEVLNYTSIIGSSINPNLFKDKGRLEEILADGFLGMEWAITKSISTGTGGFIDTNNRSG